MVKDLTGKKFGKLTVIKLDHKEQVYLSNGYKNGYRYFYLCRCECGNEKIIQDSSLISGKTKSCGCLLKENKAIGELNKTHNQTKTRLYKIWQKMKERCYNKNNNRYYCYGQRGIKVCNEWLNDFVLFYNWAINNGYKDNLTIDRIDVNGNYEPDNCRWLTNKEQSQNRRSNFNITLGNKTQCLTKWAEDYNISEGTVRDRIKRGWDIEKAIKTKVRKRA